MTTQFSCSIDTTDGSAVLGAEVWLDQVCIFNTDHVKEPVKITHDFDASSDGNHEIRFVLKNKTDTDTRIDDNNNIISDACLTVQDVQFDDIDLGYTFIKSSDYLHDFNGTQPQTLTAFYGTMGCNGVATFRFKTPIYLWLLDNM